MVSKYPIAKAGTGLLAGFLLFNNQLNAQEVAIAKPYVPPEIPIVSPIQTPVNQEPTKQEEQSTVSQSNFAISTTLPKKEEEKYPLEKILVDTKSFSYNLERQMQIKAENKFERSMLSDVMTLNSRRNTKSPYDLYTDRGKDVFQSGLEDAAKKWADENLDLGMIGDALLSPFEEREINVNFSSEDKGPSGQYLGENKTQFKANILDVNPSVSLLKRLTRETLANLKISAGDGAQLTIRSELGRDTYGYISAQYGGVKINSLNIKYDTKPNIAAGIIKEDRKMNNSGFLETKSAWQMGASLLGNNEYDSRTGIFLGGSYHRKF